MIPISFRWAFVGGFAARTIDRPLSPVRNAAESALFSALFATKTGQRILLGTAVRTAGVAGSAVGAAAGATATGIVLGAGAGAVIGAATGTAISSVAFGPEGKQKAIEFYTGQANLIDYYPPYNAYKIVRHYATEAMAE
jgi:hypothetical protein